ncbi:MAG: phosphodiester glycosidase family protein [Deltaproteobacteria bacterium]|nr:phosphodiester glycosidase family protein [Deltaproteobacteria bacterium]
MMSFLIICMSGWFLTAARAAIDEYAISVWEPLLWGGSVQGQAKTNATRSEDPRDGAEPSDEGSPTKGALTRSMAPSRHDVASDLHSSTLVASLKSHTPLSGEGQRELSLARIPPLYVQPQLPGEGVWSAEEMPRAGDGAPAVFRTTYRPSPQFPTAIAHMLLFDMKRISMRLYIGSSEPKATLASSKVEPENVPDLLAITNALWKQKHAENAGAIFRGTVLNNMVPGMATVVVYNDDSVDILEWDDDIPVDQIRDARQLKHLIVKDGKVVNTVNKGGRPTDSEIGLGYLLVEDEFLDEAGYGGWQGPGPQWGGYYGYGPGNQWSNYLGGSQLIHTSGPNWFIATRSAFGIREDGNVVFAIGHHIGTKDLARALILAGCVRAIHGDANPHNVLGNIYYIGENGERIKAAKLSPKQKDHTLKRYVNSSYTSDFFAFFKRRATQDPS